MPARRPLLASVAVGLVHATVLLAVALSLGYPVGPSSYGPLGVAWRYGALVVVAAVPTWLAARHRIVAPLVAMVLTSGYVVGMELAPPGPTFRDVAELERLAEPTGIIVVENGLYVVDYVVTAPVWTVGFLLVGAVEHVVREAWGWLPPVLEPSAWLDTPAPRRRAAIVAAAGGVLHAAAMLWFSLRIGLAAPSGSAWVTPATSIAGMWLLAAVPLYLLLHSRLLAPAALLAAFVLNDARTAFGASVDDPHALYFGAWFLFGVLLLLAAGVEAGLRSAELGRRLASLT